MFLRRDQIHMPTADEALPGRPTRPFSVPQRHFVLGTPLEPPFPEGMEQAVFGMGCFWAPSGSSGSSTACTRRQSATTVV